jgi:hypothetical protein
MRDALIAELNMLITDLQQNGYDQDEWEDGVCIETPSFMLNISIDRGICAECELNHPIFGESICEECNQDHIDMNNVIDLFGDRG